MLTSVMEVVKTVILMQRDVAVEVEGAEDEVAAVGEETTIRKIVRLLWRMTKSFLRYKHRLKQLQCTATVSWIQLLWIYSFAKQNSLTKTTFTTQQQQIQKTFQKILNVYFIIQTSDGKKWLTFHFVYFSTRQISSVKGLIKCGVEIKCFRVR